MVSRLFEFASGIVHNRSSDDVPQAAVQMRWSKFGHRRPVPTPEAAARLAADNEASLARVRRERYVPEAPRVY